MTHGFAAETEPRLAQYLEEQVGSVLVDPRHRAACAMYTLGLFSELARKSMEPIAALAFPDPKKASAAHQRVHKFISEERWDDEALRLTTARYALGAMTAQSEAVAWVIDDTGFLKQGTRSVGVQRQYTGSAGKTANCQVAVSLSITTADAHLPVDFDLFLPECWTSSPERREAAGIPQSLVFRTKHEIALAMIERAARAELPGNIILADSFYGHCGWFRDAVHLMGFEYGMAIFASDVLQRVDRTGAPVGEPGTAKALAHSLPSSELRQCAWREGTSKTLRSRFAFVRVQVPTTAGVEPRTEWLVIEWPSCDKEPANYFLTTLSVTTPREEIVRLIKERYRTEKAYEELKGELGLDHFEGRSYRGWHHHVSIVLSCYAFLVAERSRAFPPEAERADSLRSLKRASAAALSRLHLNPSTADRSRFGFLAAPLPNVPTPSREENSRRRTAIRDLRSLLVTWT